MSTPARRAAIVGTGLIGGSVGLALREQGWHVTGRDLDAAVARRALAIGAVDELGDDPDAEITFVCTPVAATAAAVTEVLAHTRGVVTDVGGVKAGIAAAIPDGRFVAGHPMAGSEQLGLDGAAADLFEGAVWVLTPGEGTDPEAYASLRNLLGSLGAEVLALPPGQHDALVAVVSHVPHLTAVALMRLANGRARDHRALLRLAAGGFRDMTRIAAGSPTIWPDVCTENREAILTTLDGLLVGLGELRALVAEGDQPGLLDALGEAQLARLQLPTPVGEPEELAEVRVPVPNRPGPIAEIATLASSLGVNIFHVETSDATGGDRGVATWVVDRADAERFREGLDALGYRSSVHPRAR